ncbi:sensor histidine kinase [Undibacterium luofuense]|uniref:Histidine kinase n=1 Tax=Undibacterium luofuense TaxID=2828733 RepID=A0A941DP37_9BURK|nr:histidine kinase [Undibacterium luofuense]MBR7783350.1 histidine kinase [Undibacterium luofuense]
MNNPTLQTIHTVLTKLSGWLSRTFDKTAAWVTQLSWWKFAIFAILTMAGGGILNDTLFSSEEVVVTKNNSGSKQHKVRSTTDGDTTVQIDDTGIRIRKNKPGSGGKEIEIDEHGIREKNSTGTPPAPPAVTGSASEGTVTAPPAPPAVIQSGDDIHIKLPPDMAREIGEDINNAVADAADEEISSYRKTSSKWFANFVMLFVLSLFGMKVVMGGKVRAEEKAREAGVAAERESLLRQVSEAKVQMMQAQVEPHFLFNTLASVEHLIETDPPRAAAMQRCLISYLRAVLPQIRDQVASTNLGREADMIRAYLELLKMRMEERLTIDYQMPEGLRTAAFPPMMLQSLVENAIKHGLECKAEGGTIRFRAEVAHKNLRVSVSDDGLGFGASTSKGTGVGLQNIRERLKLLYKDQGQLIITPNQPSGVCVTIEIPYELAD